jgi:hypothetical protein
MVRAVSIRASSAPAPITQPVRRSPSDFKSAQSAAVRSAAAGTAKWNRRE